MGICHVVKNVLRKPVLIGPIEFDIVIVRECRKKPPRIRSIGKKSEDTFEIVNTVTGIKFVRNVKFLRKAPLDKPVVFEHSDPVRNYVRCEGQDKVQAESDQKDTTCVEEMDNSQVEQKVTRSGRKVNPPNRYGDFV